MKATERLLTVKASHLLSITLLVIAFVGCTGNVLAQTWNSPDANGNISNANSGNVGIGTTPDRLFTVQGSLSSTSTPLSVFRTTGSVNGFGLFMDATGTGNNNLGFGRNGAVKASFAWDNSRGFLGFANFDYSANDFSLRLNSNGSLTFHDASSSNELFRITSGGNVGVGTMNPAFDGNTTKYLSVDGGSGTFGSVGVGGNVTSTSYPVGQMAFFNSNLSTTEKRVATIVGQTNGATNTGAISFWTASGGSFTAPTMTITPGNVGIGTVTPAAKLHVSGNTGSYTGIVLDDTASGGRQYGMESTDSANGIGGGKFAIFDGTAGVQRLTIDSGGNVGIGKTNPTVALDVVGSINVTGNINAKYQDVAEWVPSSEKLAAGTVVVLDSTKSNQVTSSSQAYDTRVAGVVSEKPGIALGEKSEGEVLVATTGRVRVRVDASKSAINIGDLLVTSDTPGVAMKSEPVTLGGVQIHRPGTLIGKALEPQQKGSGTILVLLSLQ